MDLPQVLGPQNLGNRIESEGVGIRPSDRDSVKLLVGGPALTEDKIVSMPLSVGGGAWLRKEKGAAPAAAPAAPALGVGPYRVIAHSEKDGFSRKDFETRAALIAYVVTEMGGKLAGLSAPGRTRPQLWNQPKFSNLCGPMWDGDAVRYETVPANKILST